ncbi:MAG: HEAT repeat domain-containing protein [Elusimicrobia bacterium]|nr:HEAT repeat domain-containing protein [Elusimicrobiota bacterium]
MAPRNNQARFLALGAALLLAGCVELTPAEKAALNLPPELLQPPRVQIGDPAPGGPAPKTDPLIVNSLFDLLEKSDDMRPNIANLAGTPFEELLSVGSPAAFQLRNRYLHPGVPLAEALALDPDPAFRERLETLARWERSDEVRGTALVALARLKDSKDERILHEAMAHRKPAVRFGAMEAMLAWGRPEKAAPLLKLAAENDPQPLLRVYAAGGMARLGSPDGLAKLRAFLNSPDWATRAMAARYLGDYGEAPDYDLLLDRLGAEGTNDFVAAEYAIAALKLFGKKP